MSNTGDYILVDDPDSGDSERGEQMRQRVAFEKRILHNHRCFIRDIEPAPLAWSPFKIYRSNERMYHCICEQLESWEKSLVWHDTMITKYKEVMQKDHEELSIDMYMEDFKTFATSDWAAESRRQEPLQRTLDESSERLEQDDNVGGSKRKRHDIEDGRKKTKKTKTSDAIPRQTSRNSSSTSGCRLVDKELTPSTDRAFQSTGPKVTSITEETIVAAKLRVLGRSGPEDGHDATRSPQVSTVENLRFILQDDPWTVSIFHSCLLWRRHELAWCMKDTGMSENQANTHLRRLCWLQACNMTYCDPDLLVAGKKPTLFGKAFVNQLVLDDVYTAEDIMKDCSLILNEDVKKALEDSYAGLYGLWKPEDRDNYVYKGSSASGSDTACG